MLIKGTRDGQRRRGAALLVVVIAVIVIAALSGALMGVTIYGEKESVTATDVNRALYVAEAGVSRCIAAVHTEVLDTQGQNGTNIDFGTANAPVDFGGGNFWASAVYDPAGTVTINSFGTAGGRTRGIEVVMVRNIHPLYLSAIFAGNDSGDPAYDLRFAGKANQADQIYGSVYSGGNVVIRGNASIHEDTRAAGIIDGGKGGETGVHIPPPDLASMDYALLSDVDVADAFATSGVYQHDDLGGDAWQLSESEPAHIFRKNPSDRTTDTSKTVKDDYFLEDPYETVSSKSTVNAVSGTPITLSGHNGNPGKNGSDLIYYVDGNLWIHNLNIYSFTLLTQSGTPGKLTIVVKGNIYFSDNILYQNPADDGLAFIALEDDKVADSGNIYFGDPSFGTLERMDAFMFAQNNFHDNNLSATGSAKVTVNGNMTAGNQVRITRDWEDEHSKLTVNFDNRLSNGTLRLPGLPGLSMGGRDWAVTVWHEIATP